MFVVVFVFLLLSLATYGRWTSWPWGHESRKAIPASHLGSTVDLALHVGAWGMSAKDRTLPFVCCGVEWDGDEGEMVSPMPCPSLPIIRGRANPQDHENWRPIPVSYQLQLLGEQSQYLT